MYISPNVNSEIPEQRAHPHSLVILVLSSPPMRYNNRIYKATIGDSDQTAHAQSGLGLRWSHSDTVYFHKCSFKYQFPETVCTE